MKAHEKAFAEIKNYYNDITHNNLDLIRSLKEEVRSSCGIVGCDSFIVTVRSESIPPPVVLGFAFIQGVGRLRVSGREF